MVVDVGQTALEDVATGAGAAVSVVPSSLQRTGVRQVIIDTDPGIDDALAIFMVLGSPQFEVIGLTTVFGNVTTPLATKNALYLCEVAGQADIPVAEGSSLPLRGPLPPVADFIHGTDGFGNLFVANPKGKKIDKEACDFLVEQVNAHPGEVTVVALGPLTNVALAIQRDHSFAKNLKELFVLGGAFFSAGNMTPAAEANIFGDPVAADAVFTSGANIVIIGINLTTQVSFSGSDLEEIRDSKSRFGKLVYDMCAFYRDWHLKSDSVDGIFLHDPTCMAALIDPSLFTYKSGVVRVETEGICFGHTLMDQGLKNWASENPWTNQPQVRVGWTVDVERVKSLVKGLLKQS